MLYPTVVGRNIEGDTFATSESGLSMFVAGATTQLAAGEAATLEVTTSDSPYGRVVIPIVANASTLTRFVGVYEGSGGQGAMVNYTSSGQTWPISGRSTLSGDPIWLRVRGATIAKTGGAQVGGPMKAGATAGYLVDDGTVHSGIMVGLQCKVWSIVSTAVLTSSTASALVYIN